MGVLGSHRHGLLATVVLVVVVVVVVVGLVGYGVAVAALRHHRRRAAAVRPVAVGGTGSFGALSEYRVKSWMAHWLYGLPSL